jgi:hypothetical protein
MGRTVPCRAAWIEKERRVSFSFVVGTHLPTYLPISYRSPQPTLSTILLWHQIRIIEMEGGIRRLEIEIEIVCVRACVIDTSD